MKNINIKVDSKGFLVHGLGYHTTPFHITPSEAVIFYQNLPTIIQQYDRACSEKTPECVYMVAGLKSGDLILVIRDEGKRIDEGYLFFVSFQEIMRNFLRNNEEEVLSLLSKYIHDKA